MRKPLTCRSASLLVCSQTPTEAPAECELLRLTNQTSKRPERRRLLLHMPEIQLFIIRLW